jgi:hypothetical protein
MIPSRSASTREAAAKGLSAVHHQVHVVGALRRAVHPQGVATGESERHAVGLER